MKTLFVAAIVFLVVEAEFTNVDSSKKRDFKQLKIPLFQDLLNGPNNKNQIIQQLQNRVTINSAITEELVKLMTQNVRRCSTTSPIARRIGDKCYSISTVALSFVDAQAACASLGGILAEPPLDGTQLKSFVNKLKFVFPKELSALTKSTPYIGLLETGKTSDLFQYLSSGLLVPSNNPIFNGQLGTVEMEAGAILLSSENLLTRISESGVFPNLPFICEYNVV